MPAPPEPKVTTHSQLWSVNVDLAEMADSIAEGEYGLANVIWRQPYPLAYEFSSGRRYKDGPKPNGGG